MAVAVYLFFLLFLPIIVGILATLGFLIAHMWMWAGVAFVLGVVVQAIWTGLLRQIQVY